MRRAPYWRKAQRGLQFWGRRRPGSGLAGLNVYIGSAAWSWARWLHENSVNQPVGCVCVPDDENIHGLDWRWIPPGVEGFVYKVGECDSERAEHVCADLVRAGASLVLLFPDFDVFKPA